jgi:hypothetical protein
MSKLVRLGRKTLDGFNKWFTSAAGILHTIMLIAFVVLAEHFHLIKDRNGFALLYWLTIYSAITQPMLAFVAKNSGDSEDVLLKHIESIVEHLGVGEDKK